MRSLNDIARSLARSDGRHYVKASVKRGKGRPSKDGEPSAIAMLDSLLKGAGAAWLERAQGICGNCSTNDLTGNPAQAAETLRRDRQQMLRILRPTRARKPSQRLKESIEARVVRMKELQTKVDKITSGQSSSTIAGILQRRGMFTDVKFGTLRKDIAHLKKLARTRN